MAVCHLPPHEGRHPSGWSRHAKTIAETCQTSFRQIIPFARRFWVGGMARSVIAPYQGKGAYMGELLFVCGMGNLPRKWYNSSYASPLPEEAHLDNRPRRLRRSRLHGPSRRARRPPRDAGVRCRRVARRPWPAPRLARPWRRSPRASDSPAARSARASGGVRASRSKWPHAVRASRSSRA